MERSLSPQVISDSEEEANCAGEGAGKGANGLGVRGTCYNTITRNVALYICGSTDQIPQCRPCSSVKNGLNECNYSYLVRLVRPSSLLFSLSSPRSFLLSLSGLFPFSFPRARALSLSLSFSLSVLPSPLPSPHLSLWPKGRLQSGGPENSGLWKLFQRDDCALLLKSHNLFLNGTTDLLAH